ncbi:MAG TPA: FTR1 family protein [Limnochordales bacterium]
MGAAALVMLREGIEASLIVAILLGYLHKLGQRRHARWVWMGVAAAVVASVVLAAAVQRLAERFEGPAEAVFEGLVMLAAAGVLTSMIFWMQSQARYLRGRLEHQLEQALSRGQLAGISALAFMAVLREGVESVLFLAAILLAAPQRAALWGALAGLAAAVALATLMARAWVRLELRAFFLYTGLLLVLVAAGLLASGVHELQEAGLIGVLAQPAWDTRAVLDDRGLAGSLLNALFGYRATPSVLEAAVWLAYLALVGVRYARATRPRPSPVQPAGTGTVQA